jgi:AraC-like DNA-binding protein
VVKRIHQIVQHRTGIAGVEAMTIVSEHSFPRHSHDQFGIGVMTAGAQRSWSGLGQVESRAGEIIMVNPGEMHDGAPLSGVRAWHIAYLDPSLVTHEIAAETSTHNLAFKPVAEDPALSAAVLRFFSELCEQTNEVLAREEALFYCLMRVVQKHGLNGPERSKSSPSTARAKQRLDDEPERSASLSALADLCGLSRFQLLRGFSRDIGATPHAYLVQLRVRKARRLLACGNSPVEAALLTGFADQSHLTRAFVRQFGVTPGRYQAAIKPLSSRNSAGSRCNIFQDPREDRKQYWR